MQSDQEKALRGKLAAVRHVLKTPEWVIFRDFCASRLRALWASAVSAKDDSERLRHLAAAEALITFLRDFELEEARLEGWLEFGGFESDSAEADEAERLRKVRNQPRPYRDED